MRWMELLALTATLLACEQKGGYDEACLVDGGCVDPGLACNDITHKCLMRPTPRPASLRCTYESECFCVACVDRCGDAGMRSCNYSDTSVWGAKPATCECR